MFLRPATPTNRYRDKFCDEDLEILREHLRNGGHPIATVKDMDEIIAEGNYNKLMSERIGETPESVRKYGGNTVRDDRKRGADKDRQTNIVKDASQRVTEGHLLKGLASLFQQGINIEFPLEIADVCKIF